MKLISASTLAVTTFILMLNNALATPETGFDFSRSVNTVNITTQSTNSPNVLRVVRIRCPRNGWLVAIASTRLQYTAGPAFPGTMAFSISRNSGKFSPNNQQNIFGNYVNGLHTASVHMQRIDSCKENVSYTYRFLATRGSNAANASADQPRLVVMFFRDRL